MKRKILPVMFLFIFLAPFLSFAQKQFDGRKVTVDLEGKPPVSYEEWKKTAPQFPLAIKKVYQTPVRPLWRPGKKAPPVGTDNFYVLVNQTIYAKITPAITQYIQDLEQRYPKVTLYAATIDTAEHMRDYLKNAYTTDNMVGCIVVGDFPVAWYECDGQPSPWAAHEEFPCDLYYMDMNGTWTDGDVDGKYDTWSEAGNETLEIYLGRLYASPLVGGGLTEEGLLNNYFDKLHKFRTGVLTLPHKALCYVHPDWTCGSKYNVDKPYPDTTLIEGGAVSGTDYKDKLDDGYEFIHLMCHSDATYHQFPVGGNVTNTDIKTIDPHTFFYELYACSNVRYTTANNQGNWYIFAATYGLGAVGSTKTGGMLTEYYYYTPLSQHNTFGEAFKKWFNAACLDPKWHYGMVYLGDPTTKTASPLANPPAAWMEDFSPDVTYTASFTAKWSAFTNSSANIASYDVQIKDGDGGAWTDWLASTAATSSDFTGTDKHTYYFRCRAKDYLGLTGSWSDEEKITVNSSDLTCIVYPSPFNLSVSPRMTIFTDASHLDFTVYIYDLNGELVKTLSEPVTEIDTANDKAYWTGCNSSGNKVSAGLYYIVVKSVKGKSSSKVAVIK